MLRIIYSSEGEPISDFKVKDFVDNIIDTYNTYSPDILPVKTSSELCLSMFVLRITEEKVPVEEVEFYFEDEKLEFDINKGLRSLSGKTVGFMADVTRRIVSTAIERILKSKKET